VRRIIFYALSLAFYAISLAAGLLLNSCGGPSREFRADDIIARERGALDRWSAGNPAGFLDTYAADVTYFDPTTDKRLEGRDVIKARLEPARGKFKIDRFEMVDPKVQGEGDLAVLTYNLVNYSRQPDGSENVGVRWNSTSVYRRAGASWNVIHSHWSLLKPQLKDTPSAANAPNTPNTPLGDLVHDWQQQKDGLMKIAGAMPEDKFGYKPTAAQRTYGEQILHIAESNVDVFKLMGATAPVPSFGADRTKTKAQLLAALAASYDYGTAVLGEQTADTLGTVVNTSFAGPCTRSRLAWQMLAHSMDIYGQMAVYLRLNGVVPPASQRP